jgi:hypothetical protein
VIKDVIVESGTCSLCEQKMVRVTNASGSVIDCYHPHNVERACPPEPDPTLDWTAPGGWEEFYAMGKRSGRPGDHYFVPKETL